MGCGGDCGCDGCKNDDYAAGWGAMQSPAGESEFWAFTRIADGAGAQTPSRSAARSEWADALFLNSAVASTTDTLFGGIEEMRGPGRPFGAGDVDGPALDAGTPEQVGVDALEGDAAQGLTLRLPPPPWLDGPGEEAARPAPPAVPRPPKKKKGKKKKKKKRKDDEDKKARWGYLDRHFSGTLFGLAPRGTLVGQSLSTFYGSAGFGNMLPGGTLGLGSQFGLMGSDFVMGVGGSISQFGVMPQGFAMGLDGMAVSATSYATSEGAGAAAATGGIAPGFPGVIAVADPWGPDGNADGPDYEPPGETPLDYAPPYEPPPWQPDRDEIVPVGDSLPIIKCGPDATEWFLEELRRWILFAADIRDSALEVAATRFRRAGLAPTDRMLWSAIGGNTGFKSLKVTAAIMWWLGRQPAYHRTDFVSPNCPRKCGSRETNAHNTRKPVWLGQPYPKQKETEDDSVTLFGACWHKTEMGNFIFGAMMQVLGFGPLVSKEIIRFVPGFGEATFADKAAVSLGWVFARDRAKLKYSGSRVKTWLAAVERKFHHNHVRAVRPCPACTEDVIPKHKYHPKFPKITRDHIDPVGPEQVTIRRLGVPVSFPRILLHDVEQIEMPTRIVGVTVH